MIKKHKPSLNCGLKASKDLQLFWLHFNDFIRLLIYSFNIKLIYSFFNVLIILVDEILVQILVISIQKALCIVLLWCLSVYLKHVFVKIRVAFILILLFICFNCNKFGKFTQSTLLSYFFTLILNWNLDEPIRIIVFVIHLKMVSWKKEFQKYYDQDCLKIFFCSLPF